MYGLTYGVWSMVYGPWSMVYGPWSMVLREHFERTKSVARFYCRVNEGDEIDFTPYRSLSRRSRPVWRIDRVELWMSSLDRSLGPVEEEKSNEDMMNKRRMKHNRFCEEVVDWSRTHEVLRSWCWSRALCRPRRCNRTKTHANSEQKQTSKRRKNDQILLSGKSKNGCGTAFLQKNPPPPPGGNLDVYL